MKSRCSAFALWMVLFGESASSQSPNPLQFQDFNQKVSKYLLDQIAAAKSKSPLDASWASDLYSAALKTKIVRREFLSAVIKYRDVLINHGNFFEKEEAYYAVGLNADALLTEIEQLKRVVNRSFVQLDLQDRSIEKELGIYAGQRGIVLHSVLDKPQLLGMKEQEVTALLKQLDETGKHLDASIDALRAFLLQHFPKQDLAGMPNPGSR